MKKRTVFVIGAGASNEVGMPLGPDLAVRISDRLRDTKNVRQLDEILARDGIDLRKLKEGAAQIVAGIGLANSIDEFLESFSDQPELIRIAKAAIVDVIWQSERSSRLVSKEGRLGEAIRFEQHYDTWLVQFMRLASRGNVPATELFENVTFVVLNYDRCVEHFFLKALPARYRISKEAAADILRKVHIWHPYGSIGTLPDIGGDRLPLAFGGILSTSMHAAMAPMLRTFSEEMTEPEHRDKVRQAVYQAQQIVFLGCALHRQNLELIQPEEPMSAMIFGTAFRATKLRQGYLRRELVAFLASRSGRRPQIVNPDQIVIDDMKCADLLSEYGPLIFQ